MKAISRLALEYQTATAEVLRVISRSPHELQPALNAIVVTAAGLCDGFYATILLKEGDKLRIGAHQGAIPIDFETIIIGRGWVTGRAVADRLPVHVHDLAAAAHEFPEGYKLHAQQGHRTAAAVPLLSDGEAIGAIMIRRMEVRTFSEGQIALLKTFAEQPSPPSTMRACLRRSPERTANSKSPASTSRSSSPI